MCFTCLNHNSVMLACKISVATLFLKLLLFTFTTASSAFGSSEPIFSCTEVHHRRAPLWNLKNDNQRLSCGCILHCCSCFANKVTPTHGFFSWTYTCRSPGGPQSDPVKIHALLLLTHLCQFSICTSKLYQMHMDEKTIHSNSNGTGLVLVGCLKP